MHYYDYLKSSLLPKMVKEALALMGTMEVKGPKNNPVILAWAKEVGLLDTYTEDEIPWCGLFMAVIAKRAGKKSPNQPLWAKNWLHFGTPTDAPSLGDVLVFSRNGGGHVALYVGEDNTAYHCLGGNQSDSVSITRILKGRCVGVRRPDYINQPESVKPIILTAAGSPISTNEA